MPATLSPLKYHIAWRSIERLKRNRSSSQHRVMIGGASEVFGVNQPVRIVSVYVTPVTPPINQPILNVDDNIPIYVDLRSRTREGECARKGAGGGTQIHMHIPPRW